MKVKTLIFILLAFTLSGCFFSYNYMTHHKAEDNRSKCIENNRESIMEDFDLCTQDDVIYNQLSIEGCRKQSIDEHCGVK